MRKYYSECVVRKIVGTNFVPVIRTVMGAAVRAAGMPLAVFGGASCGATLCPTVRRQRWEDGVHTISSRTGHRWDQTRYPIPAIHGGNAYM